ncbi:hypothetical protein BDP55DRAFT_297880 [Colletotrichum godetiae]|uniref:Secreted protein n=1 Tax=Colletotrichum godetiae TaxID=1209918 RepID=A0AAJ0ETD7_9PEZI|nr:uncharacterized protein BDP55DRAFT_297880 [Colletotrichum godetiae]KAK1671170.1 hypothetical protein BDP55DRAFT_297880 [Colletotrichum godetiae]
MMGRDLGRRRLALLWRFFYLLNFVSRSGRVSASHTPRRFRWKPLAVDIPAHDILQQTGVGRVNLAMASFPTQHPPLPLFWNEATLLYLPY